MDPQECYEQWIAALNREGGEDFETAQDRTQDLYTWIENGGYEPQWSDDDRADRARADFFSWCQVWSIK